ncbi:structural maintenance of chromosomes protein 6B isoform X2 [Triticum aestivum]|uniref:structural maintenance of chromosomes protein 6B isoform X2 n=1 Tax=Triticum aestivum TaxID=4565 RepID=UPI001D010289|nr:structural maintenance of chromosomes protein 6B-like isoform X2 [Triticum aestivum]
MAGTISRIRLENFMCHSSLDIELGQHVNFITGQNGSGKSAILTALCIAFGCRAKNTQRAATLKDFIKTGCSDAAIAVDINNQGEDAFKPDIYGNLIKLERRITKSSSSTILKDQHGRKVAHRKDDLNEIVEHFNIDVENPCVIISQDKSREFLHSGNDKDKFKFFFKATLLQRLKELLETIRDQVHKADSDVQELEKSIKPVMRELDELREKIKNMEHIEEIAHDIDNLKKKLAWSWVYEVDQQIEEQTVKLQKLKGRAPACQERIDRNTVVIDKLKKELIEKEENLRSLVGKTREENNMKKSMENNIAEAVKREIELEAEHERGAHMLQRKNGRLNQLQAQLRDFQMQHMQSTQAEASQMEKDMQNIQQQIDHLHSNVTRLREDENEFTAELSGIVKSINDISKEIAENDRRTKQIKSDIADLQRQQSNTVTAFGGQRVLKLLESIETNHKKFESPPIGPIGAHLQLASESWSVAVDSACGGLLDAFIVTCCKDLHVLRECASKVNFNNLRIIVYDFTRPRAPYSTISYSVRKSHCAECIGGSVPLFQGHAERQVLVKDYEVGKSLAFDDRMRNIKEVYTSDGDKIFSRRAVQTFYPPTSKKGRPNRLCSSLGEKIAELKNEAEGIQRTIVEKNGQKSKLVKDQCDLEQKIADSKRKREPEEHRLEKKILELDDAKRAFAEINRYAAVDNSELEEDIKKEKNIIVESEQLLQKIKVKLAAASREVNDRREAYKTFMDSVNEETGHRASANDELELIKRKLDAAEQEKAHYEGLMTTKVLPAIKMAEAEYADLQQLRQDNFKKASTICPESDMEALNNVAGSTPEQLSAKLNRLKQRFDQESRRHAESIDDLRALHDKKEQKILSKQQLYASFRLNINSCEKLLDLRWKKFQRNAGLLKRQLTWLFNEHLGKKGISGFTNVDYQNKVLSIELTMPQDASHDTIRDTRGLSGGERSFSTLCFALALHGMTEAPFRAMDEFDVFMDVVSRKISLDTLVDFAVAHGSQWIFITPHDISMVKPGDRVKKQQLAAPRG